MAWNEPGKDNQQNPNGSKNKPENPSPDLERVLRQLQKQINRLWGKKSPFDPQTGTPLRQISVSAIISFLLLVMISVWFLSGFYVVEQPEKAVVLRFGKYLRTDNPGMHWSPTFIDDRYIYNVQQILIYQYHGQMLTQDQQAVTVDATVNYRIAALKDYLFNVINPDESLQESTASALSQVIGQTKLNEILTSGREQVNDQSLQLLTTLLAKYQTGLVVTGLSLARAEATSQTIAATPPAAITTATDNSTASSNTNPNNNFASTPAVNNAVNSNENTDSYGRPNRPSYSNPLTSSAPQGE